MIRAFQAPITAVERFSLVAGLLLAMVLMWPTRGFVSDGAFIPLQYARHLAAGHGIVFNLGERVYACTSPLWVALIADAMALGIDGFEAARLLGGLATLASIGLVLQLTRRTIATPVLRGLATVAWAGHAGMLSASLSGLETPLAVALILAGFVAFTEGKQWGSRPVRTGALWGLAALTRPEAVFLLVLWSALLIIDAHNRIGIKRLVFGILPAAAIYGSWLVFARLYYGTFWPLGLSATTLVGGSRLAVLLRELGGVSATDGVLLLVLVLAVAFAGRRLLERPATTQSLLPWVWLTALPALYAARGVDVQSRHLLLLVPVLAWMAWRAAERWWSGARPESPRGLRVALIGCAVAALVLAQNLAVYRSALSRSASSSQAVTKSLVSWGAWLGRHAAPEALIATPEIGAIGFLSGRKVLDLEGVVTPEMIPLLDGQRLESVVANFRFAAFARPAFIVDRGTRAYDLKQRSRYGACLVGIGTAPVPSLGARGAAVYSVYRVDWLAYDRLAAIR